MAIQSVFGKWKVFEDFNGLVATTTISDATAVRYNDLSLIAISGDTDMVSTVDESGGVMAFTGAGGAGDGVAIISSPMQPSTDGSIVMEARFKNSSATDFRCWVGWQETVSLTETVNPFTLSGTTLTSNDGGNAVGFYTDTGASTDDFRFHASLDGTELTTAACRTGAGITAATTLGALGIGAGVTLTADSWYIARVIIHPGGTVEGWFGHTTMNGGAALGPRLVARLTAEGAVDQTALYYPIIMLLANSTGDPTPEIDYFGATANRDWAA